MKIDPIHTPCKNCIFAEYEGKTQKSCKLNKLQNFKDRGVEILEVYDDNLEFYVINKKKCLSYRDGDWWKRKNLSDIEKAMSEVKKENAIKYIAIIHLESDTTKDQLQNIMDKLNDQTIQPRGFLIVKEKRLSYKLSIKDLTDMFNATKKHWRIQNFIDRDLTHDQKIKSIVTSAPIDRFYFLIYPVNTIPDNVIQNIGSYIDGGGSFGCINIHNNLFFSYLTMAYAKNSLNIDLLSHKESHTNYEKIC